MCISCFFLPGAKRTGHTRTIKGNVWTKMSDLVKSPVKMDIFLSELLCTGSNVV